MHAVALLALGTWVSADERRPVPDYDGRPEPTRAGEVALWVPRVLLFPLYLVSDYVVRRPLGYAVTAIEHGLDAGGGVGLPVYFAPTLLYDRGFELNLGLHVWTDRFLADGNSLRGRVGFWGLDDLSFLIADRLQRGPVLYTARLGWAQRPDYVFYGIGPDSREADRSRFHARRLDASLGASIALATPITLSVAVGLRAVDFRGGACCDDPSLTERIAAGIYPTPHGFGEGVSALVQRVELTIDGRRSETLPRLGGHVSAEIEHGTDLQNAPDDWLRYGGTVGGFVDLTGRRRLLDLSLSARLVHPLAGAIPFTELAELGGADMAGFLEGRLLGESAIGATLRYEWPVWVWLRASLTAAVGNVFGRDLEGFDLERMRLSFTVGLRSTGRDVGLQALFGVGTDPIAAGTGLNSARVTVGGFTDF